MVHFTMFKATRFCAVVCIAFSIASAFAQAPSVPPKMHFANMTLVIRDDAMREIQKDVDALVRNPKYFEIKVERARQYFPIIHKIFEEEEVPDDLKFLVLQESSLVADAVSVSNAVGFWQFKDFTAMTMGLRVDEQIDERMNIFSASRGAAKYLKQNNEQFDNWILALQAYQMGAGGVKRSEGDKHNGKRHFEITSDTYWYIKKFIAHKVAFENAVKGSPKITAATIELKSKKTLADLAREVKVEEAALREYNKWALTGTIPDDKTYFVLVPNGVVSDLSKPSSSLASKGESKAHPLSAKKKAENSETLFVNGLRVIKAMEGEKLEALANRGGVTLARFLKFNEMEVDRKIISGSFYFLERKSTSAAATRHVVKKDDNWWSISQQYGIREKKLKKWNRTVVGNSLPVGTVIWLTASNKLRQSLPQLPEVPQEDVAALEQETFSWQIEPSTPTETKRDSVVVPTMPPAEVRRVAEPVSLENLELKRHIVKKGDTFYSMAKQYDVSVVNIARWNNLPLDSKLAVGQPLILYQQKKTAKEIQLADTQAQPNNEKILTHIVAASDTLYSIARQYGVTIKELMEWNNKKELSVKEGETIKVLKN